MKTEVSYILTHHSENPLRDKNLKAILSWIKSLKGTNEIILVEQGEFPNTQLNKEDLHGVKYIFAFNDGPFNKSWGMNIGTKNSINKYLVYIDSDCLCHQDDMEKFINKFIEGKYHAGSPNKYRYHYLNESESEYIRTNINEFRLDKKNQIGKEVSFAGGMFMSTIDVMEKIKLWDEDFVGWGFEDLAVEIKIRKLFNKVLRCEYLTFHLNHGSKTNSYIIGKDDNHQLLLSRYGKDNKWLSYIESITIKELGNRNKLKKI